MHFEEQSAPEIIKLELVLENQSGWGDNISLKCHCFLTQARHYYQIIKRPMDLSVIRAKLSKGNTQCYSSPDEFVADMYLMFRNCAKFNYVS